MKAVRLSGPALCAAVAVVLSACATARPSAPGVERWWQDLQGYEARVQKFRADSQELLEEFRAPRENPDFPAVEEKIKDVAARAAGGEEGDPQGLLIRSLYTMGLGGLVVFPRFLALSTRMVTLEATQAELEALRLDLRLRRLRGEDQPPLGTVQPVGLPAADPTLLERPLALPFRCVRYLVGSLEFANCYQAGKGSR